LDWLRHWVWIVEILSQRNLTYDIDRLVGFPGIARRFHEIEDLPPKSTVAGLWKALFAYQLLWDGEYLCATNDYLAPIWVMACRNGKMTCPRNFCEVDHTRKVVDILEAPTSCPVDPSENVTAAKLAVRGQICQLHLPDQTQEI
jgi:hypothetical protein